MKIAITGHRPDKIANSFGWITVKLGQIFTRLKPELVISGMARGVDMIAAKVAVDNEIPLLAAIPYPGQEHGYPTHEAAEYHKLLEAATKIEILADEPTAYFDAVKKLHDRNKWMVDHSNMVIAVWDGSPKGGTTHCVRYAKRVQSQRSLPIIHLNPSTRKIGRIT